MGKHTDTAIVTWRNRVATLFTEYGIYLYLFIMFLNKGESIKNIALYGAFSSWLLSGAWKKRYLYSHPIAALFWVYVVSILLSVVYSLDQAYSLDSLRGDALKAVILFPVLSTSFTSERQLKRLSAALSLSALLMTAIGFYSYLTLDLPFLKPQTGLMTAWHNRFARYLCLTTPFALVLLLSGKNRVVRAGFLGLILFGGFAVILSTSRGGMLSAALIALVWMLFMHKKDQLALNKIVMICVVVLVMVILALSISPALKTRLTGTIEDIKTVNLRSSVWQEALEGARKRPILGWGYGGDIFHRPEPHADPAYKSPTDAGPENMFISIFFHQGVIGFIAYCSLIITALLVFFRTALSAGNSVSAYMLVTVCGVILGNYIGHSLVAVDIFRGLAIVLGIGIAAERAMLRQKDSSWLPRS